MSGRLERALFYEAEYGGPNAWEKGPRGWTLHTCGAVVHIFSARPQHHEECSQDRSWWVKVEYIGREWEGDTCIPTTSPAPFYAGWALLESVLEDLGAGR